MSPADLDTEAIVREYAQNYPPLITLQEAAEIGRVSLDTIYDWSHRNRLDDFKRRRGRHVLLQRDSYVRWLAASSN